MKRVGYSISGGPSCHADLSRRRRYSPLRSGDGKGLVPEGICAANIAAISLNAAFRPDQAIDKVTVSGPSKLKKGKKKTYGVKVTNSGDAAATVTAPWEENPSS